MKVAVVHNLKRGGARRRLEHQLSNLSGEFIEVCLSTADPVTEDPVIVSYRPLAPGRARGFRPPLRYIDLAFLVRAWSRARSAVAREGADVAFVNPCRFLQAPPLLLGSCPPSLYFCDETRRVDSEFAARSSRNRMTNNLYGPLYAAERTLDRYSTHSATLLATNSQYTAHQITLMYGRAARVVPMGVADVFLNQFSTVDAKGSHLLSVGTLIPSKGHDMAIKAAALTQCRWPVVIVAPEPADREEQRLRSIARRVGVQITIRTGIQDEELRNLYRRAQATLYLARAEPLGLVSLEAQACGSPVIAAREGGLPETMMDGVTGWLVPRAPAAVAVAVDRLDDPGLRGATGAAAMKYAGSASWHASANRIAELLDEVRECA